MIFDELIDEFNGLDAEEKLETLIEFSDSLPVLSDEESVVLRQPFCRVQECQTAVFLRVSLEEGRIHLQADVPRDSPIVRGLVALIVEGVEGSRPEEISSMPIDLLDRLGLTDTLGMVRQRGTRGVLQFITREVSRLIKSP
ncbi:MAG: SufE family protein [Planctomycetota bacterium]|nr:SufE family protein [Planctomycetota bacterium]MDA1212868.1 SufE family protein [Planctomycetota bacterium]